MKFKHPKNQLALPPLLQELMISGRWQQPSDCRLATVVPFLHDPVNFLPTEESMRSAYKGQCDDLPRFHLYRGTQAAVCPLPWLDADKCLFIAVNRIPGDDVAIALDYRTSFSDPKVVASNWTDDSICHWLEVSPAFSAFVAVLRL